MNTYKKYLLTITVAVFVGFSAYNTNLISLTDGSTDTILANIQALAEGEVATGTKYTCEDTITWKKDCKTFACGPCDWVSDMEEAWNSSTKTCVKK